MTETIATLSVTKPINIMQLQSEMAVAGVNYGSALLLSGDTLYCYDAQGLTTGFADSTAAQTVLDAHVAMRDKTSEEYAAEFQNPSTTVARKQEIRDIQNGLLPPEQVPMEAT